MQFFFNILQENINFLRKGDILFAIIGFCGVFFLFILNIWDLTFFCNDECWLCMYIDEETIYSDIHHCFPFTLLNGKCW